MSRSLRRSVFVIVALAAVGGTAAALWRAGVERSQALMIAPTHLDFGALRVGENAERSVVLTNLDEEPLVIERISAEGAFRIGARSLELAPGESRSLAVRFEPEQSGRVETRLLFEGARAEAEVALAGEALGLPDISVEPRMIDFGAVGIGARATALVTVANHGEGELEVAELMVRPPFRAELEERFIPAGEHRSIQVVFEPERARAWSEKLRIGGNDPNVLRTLVNVEGEGVEGVPSPRIAVNPAALDFGAVPVGLKRRGWLSIRNEGDHALTLSSLTIGGPFAVSARSRSIPAGGRLSLPVVFAPNGAGASFEPLLIHSNDPEQGVVIVTALGQGVEGAVGEAGAGEDSEDGAEAIEIARNGFLPPIGDVPEGVRRALESGEAPTLFEAGEGGPEGPDDADVEPDLLADAAPEVLEGSELRLAGNGFDIGTTTIENVTYDEQSGTLLVENMQLPAVCGAFHQCWEFDPTTAVGTVGPLGEVEIAMTINMRVAEGNVWPLEFLWTTETSTIMWYGVEETIQGQPLGPDGVMEAVALFQPESGPFKNAYGRIRLPLDLNGSKVN